MEQTENGKSRRSCDIFFWGLAAVSLLCCLGVTMLYAAEARYAEAVREMFLSGDWLQPTFNWEALSPRPLFMHWMMLLSCRIAGVCNEFSLRLPSVLAGLLTLVAVRKMGTRLCGPECGRTAGYLLLGCFGFLFWSRSAAAEMWNTCLIAVGILWFYELRENPGFRNVFRLALFFLLGTQFKGIFAASALWVLLLFALLNRDFLRRMMNFRVLAALLLAGALFGGLKYLLHDSVLISGKGLSSAVAWVTYRIPWAGGKVFRQPFFYFRELPLLFLPWTLVLFLCPAGMLREWKKQSGPVRELLCGVLLMLILLTLLPWTQGYYALGMLIPLTVCSAAALTQDEGVPMWNHFSLRLMQAVATAAASAAVVSLIFFPFWKRILGYHPPVWLLLSIPTIGAAALWVLFCAEFDPQKTIASLTGIRQNIAVPLLALDLLCCGFTAILLPQYHLTRTERIFLTGLHDSMRRGSSAPMVYWGNPALRFLFYFNQPEKLRTCRSVKELKQLWDASPQGVWLLTRNAPEEMEQLEQELTKLHIPFRHNAPFSQEKLRATDRLNEVKIAVFQLTHKTADLPASPEP